MNRFDDTFKEFAPVTTEEWMEKITADLKGADFNKKLVWRTREGFEVMPFHRSENLKDLKHLGTMPGMPPFLRGGARGNNWLVRQNINVTDFKEANAKALDILMKGIDSLGFIIEDATAVTHDSIALLLEGIDIDSVELNFAIEGRALELIHILENILKERGVERDSLRGSVEADPLGRLMLNGELCVPVEDGIDYLASLFSESSPMTSLRVLQVNGASFNNAGADTVTEMAFILSLGNEYLSQLTGRGIATERVATGMGFTVAIGSNYFMEIAKLRALRALWATVVKKYGLADTDGCCMKIASVTTEWNKTAYDPYVNMLRTQTEAMSATIGGTDSLLVDPFDKVFATPDNFSERIARNQQLLLREEAYFGKVADPSAGSYYIEKLTAMLIDSAWKLFLEVEERGGFLKALREGFIQDRVAAMADKRVADIGRRKEIFVGTNQYPSSAEKLSDRVDIKRLFGEGNGIEGKQVKPLRIIRGAEEFEKLRYAAGKMEKRPKVSLLTVGNLKMRMARSQFAANFFGCAGYEIIGKGPYKSGAEGAEAALGDGASLVVVCSSDEEYAEVVPQVCEVVKDKAVVVVAGLPECADELRKIGVNHFISVRSNVLETLREFHSLLGIDYKI